MSTIVDSIGTFNNGKRYQVTIRHGESKTIAYVIDTEAPREEQPAIVFCSSRMYASTEADLEATCRNRAWESKCSAKS